MPATARARLGQRQERNSGPKHLSCLPGCPLVGAGSGARSQTQPLWHREQVSQAREPAVLQRPPQGRVLGRGVPFSSFLCHRGSDSSVGKRFRVMVGDMTSSGCPETGCPGHEGHTGRERLCPGLWLGNCGDDNARHPLSCSDQTVGKANFGGTQSSPFNGEYLFLYSSMSQSMSWCFVFEQVFKGVRLYVFFWNSGRTVVTKFMALIDVRLGHPS